MQKRQHLPLGWLVLCTPLIACGGANVTPSKTTPTSNATPQPQPNPEANPSGSPAASGSASIVGRALNFKAASFSTIVSNGLPLLVVKLSDQADDCTLVGNNARRGGSSTLVLALFKLDGQGHAPAPDVADYIITDRTNPQNNTTQPGGFGSASLSQFTSTCEQQLADKQAVATSGTIHITALTSGADARAVGTFQLTIGTEGDKVSGSFDAVNCATLGPYSLAETHQCIAP